MYKEDTSATDSNRSPNALKVTPRQKKKKKYRKKQNKTTPDNVILSSLLLKSDSIAEWRLNCFVVSGVVLFCFFLYFFFFFCLGVTFKAFGDLLESVAEVSSLYLTLVVVMII
jgi:hypothetical protein